MAKSLEEIKAERPEFSDMSNDDLFEHLHSTYYSKLPRTYVAEKLGYEFPDRGFGGDAKEVARQAAGGILVDTPRMAAQAVQAFDKDNEIAQKVIDYADRNEESFAPDKEGEGFVAGILSAGARALGPTLTAGAGFIAGPEVGIPLTAGLFGGSAYDETYDKAKAAGASDFEANEAGLKTGAIQGLGESVDTLVGVGPLLKLSKGILTNSAKTIGESIAKQTAPDVLKPFAKALGTSFVVQGTSEVIQDTGSKAVEQSYGIDDDPRSYAQVAGDALKGTTGLTLFLGVPGLRIHFKHAQLAQEVDAVLTDPSLAPKEQRLAIVESLHKGAVDSGVAEADTWLVGAKNDVDNDRPIRRTAELTTADIGEAPTVDDAVEAFTAVASKWETPTFDIRPDAEKIIANRNVPGIPVQQAIDAQYESTPSYVPAEQPWEKPSYVNVKPIEPVRPDDSRQLSPDNAGRSDRMVSGVVDTQPAGPERNDTTQPTGELNVTNVRHDKTPIFGDPTETSHITESGYTYRNVGTKEIESILKTGYALAPEKSKGGRKGVKHWSKGDGRLFYNDSLNVIRLKDTLFKREGAIPATSLEIWDKTSNSFHNLIDTTQSSGELNELQTTRVVRPASSETRKGDGQAQSGPVGSEAESASKEGVKPEKQPLKREELNVRLERALAGMRDGMGRPDERIEPSNTGAVSESIREPMARPTNTESVARTAANQEVDQSTVDVPPQSDRSGDTESNRFVATHVDPTDGELFMRVGDGDYVSERSIKEGSRGIYGFEDGELNEIQTEKTKSIQSEPVVESRGDLEKTVPSTRNDEIGNSVSSQVLGGDFTADERAEIAAKRGVVKDIKGWARGRFGADRVKGVEFSDLPTPTESFKGDALESFVTPNKDGKRYNVSAKDVDSGEALGSVTIVNSKDEAIARAKKIAGVESVDKEPASVKSPGAVKKSAPKPVVSQNQETKTQAKDRVLKEIDEALKTAGTSQYKSEMSDEDTARLKEIKDEKEALGGVKDSDKDNSRTQRQRALTKERQAIHARHIDYVTFKVAGTTYRVGNSKERLENFKRLIKAAPLSPDVGTPGKSFPARQSVAEFVKDGEEANGYYAAELAGISVGFGYSNVEPGYVFYIDTAPVVISDLIPGSTFVGRHYSGKTDGWQWRVVHNDTGRAVGEGSKTKDAAIVSAKTQVEKTRKRNGDEWVTAQLTRLSTDGSSKNQEQLLKLFKEKNDIVDEVEPTPDPEPPKKEELNDFQKKSRAYWQDDVVPAFDNYLRAYRRLGADMLERNLIKPESVNATQWLESLWRQQSVWDKTRKIKQTGLQFLSQKDLWPTKIEGAGENLRKSMIAVIKALNKSPGSNGHWLQNQEDGKDPFAEPSDGERFSKSVESSLVIVHNLSLENLIHADKMGGIAAPSVAVTDKNSPMDSFGEISLVGDKNVFGPQADSRNKFFNADVYSPRYPTVKSFANEKAVQKAFDGLSESAKKLYAQIGYRAELNSNTLEDGLVKGLRDNVPLKYQYAESLGKAPKLTYTKPTVAAHLKPFVKTFTNRYQLLDDPAFKKAIVDQFNGQFEGEERVEVDSREARNLASHVSYEVENAAAGPRIDVSAVEKKLRSRIEQSEYEAWLRGNYSDLIDSEKIPNGFTYSGRRKYLPHNLDTVVKLLTKTLRGGEGFNYGVPSIRAHAAKQFKTVKALQDARGDLVTRAKMEELKDEVGEEFDSIADELAPYTEFQNSLDTASEALAGLASKGYREFREYYKGVPPETMQKVVEFLDKLKHMPSEYFEGKIGRAVRIGEFSGAIVPKGKKYDKAIEILNRKGIVNIKRYDTGNDESRSKALQSFEDLLFSQSPGKKTGSTVESIESLLPKRTRKVVSVVQSIRDVPGKAESFYTITNIEGFYDPAADKLYLVADQLTPETMLPVLQHELLHRAELTDPKLKAAMERFEDYTTKRFNLASKGLGSAIEKAAYKRVIAAEVDPSRQLEEFRAYIVSEYVKAPRSMVDYVRDLIAAIRMALVRAGLDFGAVRSLTPADLYAMSKYGARPGVAQPGTIMASVKVIPETISINGKERSTRNSNGQLIHSTEDGIRNFYKWFGDSKVVDAQGGPLVVYHGSKSLGDEFRRVAGGIYFAEDSQISERYTSDAKPKSYYLKSDKHFDVDSEYAESALDGIERSEFVDDADEVLLGPDGRESLYELAKWGNLIFGGRDVQDRTFNALHKLGHTGVKIRDFHGGGENETIHVVFNPDQIKSAIENSGSFDSKTDSVLFSRSVEDIWSEAATLPKTTAQDVAEMFRVKGSKTRSKSKELALSALTQNQLIDIGSQYVPKLKEMGVQRNNYDVEETRWHAKADILARKWERLVKGSKGGDYLFNKFRWNRNRIEQARLSDMMHTMTATGIDPRKPKPVDVLKAEYDELKRKYDLLLPDTKKLLDEVDKFHTDVLASLIDTLTGRIETAEMPEESKQKLIDDIKEKFQIKSGPYFPLMRFGSYWVNYGEGVQFFESKREQEQFVKKLTEEGTRVLGYGKSLKNFNKVEGVDPTFVDSVTGLIDELDVENAEALKDGIFQLYLSSLPEQSMRKRFIHRKTTPGWETDALRSFSKKAFHDGKQLAKLKYAPAIRQVLQDADEIIKIGNSKPQQARLDRQIELSREVLDKLDNGVEYADLPDQYEDAEDLALIRRFSRFTNELDREKAISDYLNERLGVKSAVDAYVEQDDPQETAADIVVALRKSYDNMMNPTTNQLTNLINQTVFTYMLGFNPSSAMVNYFQTPGVAVPLISGRHGFFATNKEFVRSVKTYFANSGEDGHSIESGLVTQGERDMYAALTANGTFDRTRSHDLAGFSEEGVARGTIHRTFMNMATYMFHSAEVANREITALMAYRMEFKKSGDVKKSIEYANEIVKNAHLDYSSSNRPDLFHGNAARVMLQFKMYSQGMTYIWGKTTWDALKADGVTKTEARKALLAFIGVQVAMAGTLSLPIGGILMGAQMIANLIDDNDDPVDVEQEIRDALGEVLSDGLLSPATGADVASRLNLSDLWIREPDRELEGKDQAYYLLKTILGPAASIVENMAVGVQMLGEGNTQRGVETMLPNSIKDVAKAYRFIEEGGAATTTGNLIYETNVWEKALQATGFRPYGYTKQMRENSEYYNKQGALTKTRTKLIGDIAKAEMKGESTTELEQQRKEWNVKYPTLKITRMSIIKSKRLRKANKEKARNGIVVKKNYQFLLE